MKDPAFLFYTKDFLSGIQDLTMEERGQYITLLCLQHQKGHLSEKAIRLCVGNAAADVMAKFRQDSAGLWYNIRLEQEIEKRAAHSHKQKERAIEGWKKRKNQTNESTHQTSGTQSGNAAALPLVNGDANGNVDGIKNKKESEIDFTKPDIDGDTIIFPLDTKPVRELWASWKKYRWEQYGARYKLMGEQSDLKRLEGMNFSAIEKTILTAIANNWKNLYPEKNGRSTSKPGTEREQRNAATIEYLKNHYGNKSG